MQPNKPLNLNGNGPVARDVETVNLRVAHCGIKGHVVGFKV